MTGRQSSGRDNKGGYQCVPATCPETCQVSVLEEEGIECATCPAVTPSFSQPLNYRFGPIEPLTATPLTFSACLPANDKQKSKKSDNNSKMASYDVTVMAKFQPMTSDFATCRGGLPYTKFCIRCPTRQQGTNHHAKTDQVEARKKNLTTTSASALLYPSKLLQLHQPVNLLIYFARHSARQVPCTLRQTAGLVGALILVAMPCGATAVLLLLEVRKKMSSCP